MCRAVTAIAVVLNLLGYKIYSVVLDIALSVWLLQQLLWYLACLAASSIVWSWIQPNVYGCYGSCCGPKLVWLQAQ